MTCMQTRAGAQDAGSVGRSPGWEEPRLRAAVPVSPEQVRGPPWECVLAEQHEWRTGTTKQALAVEVCAVHAGGTLWRRQVGGW